MRHLREVSSTVATPSNDKSVITVARGENNPAIITIDVKRYRPGAKVAEYSKSLSMDYIEAQSLYWTLHRLFSGNE
jgi:hypothetical protein